MDDRRICKGISCTFAVYRDDHSVSMNKGTTKILVRITAFLLAILICLPMLFFTGCSSQQASSEATAESASEDMTWQEPTYDMEKETDRVIEVEVLDANDNYIFTVDWQNPDTTAKVDITAPDGTVFSSDNAEVARVSGSTASILVDPAQNGTYSVHIVGNGLGNIAIANSSWKGSTSNPLTEDSATSESAVESTPEPTPVEEGEDAVTEEVIEGLDLKQIVNDAMPGDVQLAYPAQGMESLATYFPEWDTSLFDDIAFSVSDGKIPHAVVLCKPAEGHEYDAVTTLGSYQSDLLEKFTGDSEAAQIVSNGMLSDIQGYTVLIISSDADSIFMSMSEDLAE